ncbi:hypothetical protein [Ktedonobacter sp. SOSP1-52]|uniref:hypothetical protein n=1 Tax=Ktedonobacter sp. SOSP1-52 TaxID=2778366 RepID=UPI001915D488|nr:hypothetical protein [Ktedonobacter sp. SOSP1-52]
MLLHPVHHPPGQPEHSCLLPRSGRDGGLAPDIRVEFACRCLLPKACDDTFLTIAQHAVDGCRQDDHERQPPGVASQDDAGEDNADQGSEPA